MLNTFSGVKFVDSRDYGSIEDVSEEYSFDSHEEVNGGWVIFATVTDREIWESQV
jgi:hypothetical protein